MLGVKETLSTTNMDNYCEKSFSENKRLLPHPKELLKKGVFPSVKIDPKTSTSSINLVYTLVCPDDLNLKPAPLSVKPRGRPKKSKVENKETLISESPKSKIKVVQRTRSGRTVKIPKFIENEFQKVEINDQIETADIIQHNNDEPKVMPSFEFAELHQKKRKISSQYRCPKCKKAYLGKSRIIDHLKKYPSHGPFYQNEDKNFEVWNYLVHVTQQHPSSERGTKFCQELSNLLHNLLLLTNAIFKKLGNAANEVKIDKVLGNAIGLTPGSYYFDDNNLYKDVTFLKLMTSNDFLNSIKNTGVENQYESSANSSEKDCDTARKNIVDESIMKTLLISPTEYNKIPKKFDNINTAPLTENNVASIPNETTDNFPVESTFFQSNSFTLSSKNFCLNEIAGKNNQSEIDHSKSKSPKIKIQSDILICPAHSRNEQTSILNKCVDVEAMSTKNVIKPELLSDNSVLAPPQNDVMMADSSVSGHLLGNSSSSDELINVDQFVNERFKKITEPEVDVMNSNSLNLDLPLDLFHFNT